MLNQILVDTVKKHSEKAVFAYDSLRISYKDLYSKVVGLSNGLSSIGINQSDCIAVILPNCPEFLISFYATAKLNAIVLPLNPLFKEEELKYYISDSNAKAIITDLKRAATCHNVISQLGRQIDLIVVDGIYSSSIYFEDLIKEETDGYEKAVSYEGDMLYQYSSGSTGRPKRVCRTQKNLVHGANNFTTTARVRASDNILCIVPFFHAHGLENCLLAATYTGATLTVLEEVVQNGTSVEVPFIFRCPRVLELIQKEKVTIIPGVAYMFKFLADGRYKTQVDVSTVRLCFSGGNFLPKDVFDKFKETFGLPIKQLYGSTEAGAISMNVESESEVGYDSVGLPLGNVKIKIIDEQGNELSCGIGEVVIKSPAMTSGYHNMPELNEEAFKDGYFFTGDLGKKDDKGRLYITGRKKIFIDTGGHKVDPLEIENILITHPKVEEVVVVGTKDPYVGELIKAIIVLKDKCKEQEILSYCTDKLAGFKIPKIIEFREEIPKSALGKILRKSLI